MESEQVWIHSVNHCLKHSETTVNFGPINFIFFIWERSSRSEISHRDFLRQISVFSNCSFSWFALCDGISQGCPTAKWPGTACPRGCTSRACTAGAMGPWGRMPWWSPPWQCLPWCPTSPAPHVPTPYCIMPPVASHVPGPLSPLHCAFPLGTRYPGGPHTTPCIWALCLTLSSPPLGSFAAPHLGHLGTKLNPFSHTPKMWMHLTPFSSHRQVHCRHTDPQNNLIPEVELRQNLKA